LAANERAAPAFQSFARGGRHACGRCRQAMRPGAVRPALPGTVEVALARRRDGHTGVADTRRTRHRCRSQITLTNHDL